MLQGAAHPGDSALDSAQALDLEDYLVRPGIAESRTERIGIGDALVLPIFFGITTRQRQTERQQHGRGTRQPVHGIVLLRKANTNAGHVLVYYDSVLTPIQEDPLQKSCRCRLETSA